jgi:hypothetical protein
LPPRAVIVHHLCSFRRLAKTIGSMLSWSEPQDSKSLPKSNISDQKSHLGNPKPNTQNHVSDPKTRPRPRSGAKDGFLVKTVCPMQSDSDILRSTDDRDAETSWRCYRSGGAPMRQRRRSNNPATRKYSSEKTGSAAKSPNWHRTRTCESLDQRCRARGHGAGLQTGQAKNAEDQSTASSQWG